MTSLGRSVLVESARDVTSRATTHDHLVQFYESEDFLPGIVSGFLAAGLRARQPVIAISTARHREAFVARLASAGIDAGEATRAGQLALLDADEALAAILVDGAPSWDRFRAVVGGAIEAVAGGPFGKKVRAYGEMVDVLWRSGNARAALRLEEMWNGLSRTHPISLLCTYAMGNFAEEIGGWGIRDVCERHAYVVPGESWARVGGGDARLREVVRLQQRAQALERELERRREMEAALREVLEEKKRLEEQLREQNQALARAVRLSETFVGMLGHDLRNPLNAISTAASLVARRSDCEKISKLATRIVGSSRRMARMIDQILDFTRIRLGRGLPLEPRPIDLADVCRLTTEELEGEAEAPRVRLETSGDVAGTWDADRLAQLVSNLLGNALAHGRPGGTVSIRVDGNGERDVVLEVENAGAITPEVLPTLFEPFAACSGRGGGSSCGLGLGLHISREIAVAHGGSIDVTSSVEGWTRFTVRLPRTPVQRS